MELLPGFELGERVSLVVDGERIIGTLLDVDDVALAVRVTHWADFGHSQRALDAAEDMVQEMSPRQVRWELVKSGKVFKAVGNIDSAANTLLDLILDESGSEKFSHLVPLSNPVKRLVQHKDIERFESADDLDLDTTLTRLEG